MKQGRAVRRDDTRDTANAFNRDGMNVRTYNETITRSQWNKHAYVNDSSIMMKQTCVIIVHYETDVQTRKKRMLYVKHARSSHASYLRQSCLHDDIIVDNVGS